MRRGIIVSEAVFNALNNRVVKALRKKGHVLERWCTKDVHPVTGDLVFRTSDRIDFNLKADERADIIDITDEWYPVIDSE